MTDMTLEQVDSALANARQRGAPERDIAMLWIARAHLLGVDGVGADHLVLVMGVTRQRALDLLAILGEEGLVERS